MLDNPEFETTPPDQLASVTYPWQGKSLDEINSMAENLPSSIIRAKGFVNENDKIHIFSYVMGDWTIESCTKNEKEIQNKNMIVFIGSLAAIDGIQSAFTTKNWTARQVVQPFGHIGAM